MSPQKSDDCGACPREGCGWSRRDGQRMGKRINGWRAAYPLIRFLSVDHKGFWKKPDMSPQKSDECGSCLHDGSRQSRRDGQRMGKRINGWRAAYPLIRFLSVDHKGFWKKPDMSPQKSDECGSCLHDGSRQSRRDGQRMGKRINGWRAAYPLIRFLSVDHKGFWKKPDMSPQKSDDRGSCLHNGSR